MSDSEQAIPCSICGTPTQIEEEPKCPPCKALEYHVQDTLKYRPAAFYKIIHKALEPYQMVCVSKTILPEN